MQMTIGILAAGFMIITNGLNIKKAMKIGIQSDKYLLIIVTLLMDVPKTQHKHIAI